jgi:hypothetical protein
LISNFSENISYIKGFCIDFIVSKAREEKQQDFLLSRALSFIPSKRKKNSILASGKVSPKRSYSSGHMVIRSGQVGRRKKGEYKIENLTDFNVTLAIFFFPI